MPIAPLPFANQQAGGLDELSGASPLAMNVVSDSTGTIHRRPGIVAYSGAPSTVVDSGGIAGLYETDEGKLYAVGSGLPDRAIYHVTSGGAVKLGLGAPSAGLLGTKRPVFAEGEQSLLIAGGLSPQKVATPTNVSARLGGSPPWCSHIIINRSRALANELPTDASDPAQNQTRVRYSEPADTWPLASPVKDGGYEGWDLFGLGTAGSYQADSRPDPLVAIAANSNEIFNFGSQSLDVGTLQLLTTSQTSLNAGQMMFVRTVSLEVGCSAPYSPVKLEQKFAWLDHLHRFVMSDGRSFQVISEPIQRTLDEISVVDDCFGYSVSFGYIDVLVWTFPTDGRTFAFQKGAGWSQWSGWGKNWAPFAVTASTTKAGASDVIVGTSDGYIGKLSLSSSTDLGTPIHAFVSTGYVSRETQKNKLCRAVRLSLKRGKSTSTPGPSGFLRFRDRPGDWEGPIPIDFGSSGDTEIVIPFYGLGTYRSRQWSFEFAGTDELTLVSATEEFEVLET